MARFKKSEKPSLPGINTGSMSDIIFMFLFFFMVITTIREATLFVKVKVPVASEVQKLERKALVSYIYIGQPINTNLYGVEPRIQLNDVYAMSSDIGEFVFFERARRNESERPLITFSLKVDEETKMGVVTDVKQELRFASAFKINYSTRRGDIFKMK
jgi:biopolymer transport protein ExbD